MEVGATLVRSLSLISVDGLFIGPFRLAGSFYKAILNNWLGTVRSGCTAAFSVRSAGLRFLVQSRLSEFKSRLREFRIDMLYDGYCAVRRLNRRYRDAPRAVVYLDQGIS
jgi:hypothetical protein